MDLLDLAILFILIFGEERECETQVIAANFVIDKFENLNSSLYMLLSRQLFLQCILIPENDLILQKVVTKYLLEVQCGKCGSYYQ